MNTKVKSFFDRQIFQELGMSTTRTIELVRKLSNGKPLNEKTATELLDYIANQNDNLATKQDIENVENKIELVKKDVEGVKQDVKAVRTETRWLYALGFGTILMLITYLHSDTGKRVDRIRTDMQEMRTDMQEMRTDMQEIRTDMQEVRKELTELKKLIIERTGRR